MSQDFEFENDINRIEEIEESGFDSSEFGQEKYVSVKKEELISAETGEVIDKSTITTWDHIKAIAKKLGKQLRDKPQSSCKHCYGRGHINYIAPGSDTVPIPCSCIFITQKDKDDEQKNPMTLNRAAKRKMAKTNKKYIKKYRELLKNVGQEELKQKEEENVSTETVE
jgi:hypothetical protein